MLGAPEAEITRIYGQLGVDLTDAARGFALELAETPTATALSRPRIEKWREQNPEAVSRILPLVAEVEARLGYDAGATRPT